MARKTARPSGSGALSEMEAICDALMEIAEELQPGLRIHHLGAKPSYRDERRRGNRFYCSVILERVPNQDD